MTPLSSCGAVRTGLPGLLAWADRAGQTAVINAVFGVPKRLAEFDSFSQDFNLVGRARWGVGGMKVVDRGREIFVVPILQYCLEHIFDLGIVHFVAPQKRLVGTSFRCAKVLSWRVCIVSLSR